MNDLQKKPSKKWKYIGWFIAFVVFLNVFTRIPWPKSEAKQEVAAKPEIKNTFIFVLAQQAVKDRLKAPATAEFPYSDEASFVGGLTDSLYEVRSYVDSQNSFGANLRSNFSVKLKYLGGEADNRRSWQVLETVVE